MSRCFPYPPPGYTKGSVSGGALIESIKLEREKEKFKTERKKDRKREKKEKKRAREREKSSQNYPGEGKRLSDSSKGCHLQKSTGNEVEQLEQSSITEDHDLRGCLQKPSESSDSTHNSHKRKREASPLKSCSNRGKIIRIRLSLQGPIDSEPRVGKEVCSISGKTESLAQPKDAASKLLSSIHPCTGVVSQNLIERTKKLSSPVSDKTGNFGGGCAEAASVSVFQNGMQRVEYPAQPIVANTKLLKSFPTITSAVGHDLIHRPEKEMACPTSEKTGNFGHSYAKGGTVSKRNNRMQRVESHYKSLTENWFPVQPTQQADFGDIEWLLETKQDDGRERAKKCKTAANNDGLRCRNTPTLFPCACLLSEADVYALPFTIPF